MSVATERITQYNASVEALNAAVEAVRTSPEGNSDELAKREAAFRDALAETERCKANLDRAEELDGIEQRFPMKPVPTPPAELGMDGREVRSYSFLRAINASIQKDWTGAEMEREASEEIAKRLGREPQGFFVPMDVQREQRVMSVGTTTAGGDFVSTDLLSASFIDMLRNAMVVRRAGATVLGGLVGNIAIPRQTGGGTFYWITTEGSAATGSTPAIDQVTMTPHTGGTYTDIYRKLLQQSSIDVENFVRTDLAMTCAVAMDRAALHGANASGEPCGIENTSGIGSVVGGASGLAPTWAHMVSLETEVAQDNADVGNVAYMTNAKVRGKLKSTAKVSSSDSRMIWDENNGPTPLNGYPVWITNQVKSDITKVTSNLSAIFFGNWRDLIIGEWGTLDILVDPYTGSTSGTVRIVALQDIDIAVRHAESFSAMLDAITA